MLYTFRTFPFECAVEEADACLVGVPWDSTEIGRPVRYGPLFIRQALKELPGFDPDTGTRVFDRKLCDLGDVEPVAGSWPLTRDRILDTITHLKKLNPRALPLILGGDHLITLAALEALKQPGLTVVHFDAHADASSDWMGEPFSHITWGYHAVSDLGLDLVQLGVRSWTPGERDFLEQNRHRLKRLEDISGPVYVTVDLDVFDPAHAPDVGTPEPLGMEPKEFFPLLQRACAHPLVGLDVVECASTAVGTQTALLAAQIIKKVLAWQPR